MLVLNRNFGQSIMIGDDIKVTFLEPNEGHSQITIGIEAPKEVPVHREEIYKRIKEEDKA